MKFRKHFDYDVERASVESSIDFSGIESLTVQSMAEDADINVLMERYGITGKMPENPRMPSYGDFTVVTDYQSALNAIMQASDDFYALPAKVRARFNNNPQELLVFVSSDANIEEARSLGLLKGKSDGRSGSVTTGSGASGATPQAGSAAGGDPSPKPA